MWEGFIAYIYWVTVVTPEWLSLIGECVVESDSV